jgi:hypothetical protein
MIGSIVCRSEMHTGFWWGNVKERNHLHELTVGIDGKITLRLILQRWEGRVWTGFIWFRTGNVAGICEHGNKPAGSIQWG